MIHYRTCNLCEAMCGLAIEHDGKRALKIRGDEKDPFSRGYICPKGARMGDIHTDPDRLRRPLRKTADGFVETSWDQAFDIIEERITSIRQQHGDDAVAMYAGNPTVHNLGSLLGGRGLRKALGSKNLFSATSVDQLPHHFAAYYMFGDPLRLPIPDLDRCDFLLMLGANPVASNGSLMSAAGVKKRLEGIAARGAWVVIDPRRTESAALASQHHAIRPGSDVFFLLAMLHTILELGPEPGRLQQHLSAGDELHEIARPFSPERVAATIGIEAAVIRELSASLLRTPRAAIYGRMGVSTHPHGGLNQWLINVLNILTGHLDSEGGVMFPTPAIEIARDKPGRKRHCRWHSRVRKAAEFHGELPVAVMAEEMLTPGPGQIRALISSCGNPLLSTPDSKTLDRALAGLDFMLSIDIYLNETSRHADIILPPPTGLEVDHYDLAFHALAISNHAKFSEALFAPEPGQLYDHEIFAELTRRLSRGRHKSLRRRAQASLERRLKPRQIIQLGLLTGAYGRLAKASQLRSGLDLGTLIKNKHGIDLGPLRPRLPEVINTTDGKIHLAAPVFTEAARELEQDFLDLAAELETGLETGSFRLIGRRHLRSNNSWMHNSERLTRGAERCTLALHPDDARRLKLHPGQQVSVRSEQGEITLPLELSEDIMPGVACIPHGYGHDKAGSRLRVASRSPGANVNELASTTRLDPLTGNAAFSGLLVTVAASDELP